MSLLEHERWIAPLADELHAALSLHLARKLPAATAGRITLEVRRWDATLGGANRLEALWVVQVPGQQGQPRSCQAVLQRGAGATVEALAASHRALVEELAQRIASCT
jgi:uncharacterized protein